MSISREWYTNVPYLKVTDNQFLFSWDQVLIGKKEKNGGLQLRWEKKGGDTDKEIENTQYQTHLFHNSIWMAQKLLPHFEAKGPRLFWGS